jgi:hypothetical protein
MAGLAPIRPSLELDPSGRPEALGEPSRGEGACAQAEVLDEAPIGFRFVPLILYPQYI